MFDSALRKLEEFPADYCQLYRSRAIAAAAAHRVWAEERIAAGELLPMAPGEFPSLQLLTTPELLTPPEDPW